MKLPISVQGLDATELGNVLVRLAVTSQNAGHKSVRHTAKDYVLPHAETLSPEARFVAALFCYPAGEVLVEEEAWTMQELIAERLYSG